MTDVTAIGIPCVHVALNAVKTAVGAVGKKERNAAQGFNFRGIDAVVNACAPALNDNGIVITPELLDYTYETVEIGKNKTPMAHVVVRAAYRFYGPAGDSVTSVVLAEAMDSGDKACAKAMSVAYRIALLQTLNLPTDEPDPDSESYERSSADARVIKGSPKPVDWAESVYAARTVGELRAVWKNAGAAGALQDKITASDGAKMTVQELLYKMNDELALAKSARVPDSPPVA